MSRLSPRGSAALVSLATALTVAACAAPGATSTGGSNPTASGSVPAARTFSGPLVDLQPATASAFDSARAELSVTPTASGQVFAFAVSGAAAGAAGQTFGAHLHTGPCVAGNGVGAGPHYNHSTATPPVIGPATEVWLDVTIRADGMGASRAEVGFTPPAATRSVVVHAKPTDAAGAAGDRIACLPVVWQ